MLKCRNGAGVLFMVEMALSNIYIYRERESERERQRERERERDREREREKVRASWLQPRLAWSLQFSCVYLWSAAI
jgi:hypothetical protein